MSTYEPQMAPPPEKEFDLDKFINDPEYAYEWLNDPNLTAKMRRSLRPGGITMVKELDETVRVPYPPKEEDPNGKDAHEPGAKLDAGKPDCSLLGMFGKALSAVAMVGTHGANKYTRGGWRAVPNGEHRYTAAMLRHYFAENDDAYDSDLPDTLHAAQVAWNALARLEFIIDRISSEKEE